MKSLRALALPAAGAALASAGLASAGHGTLALASAGLSASLAVLLLRRAAALERERDMLEGRFWGVLDFADTGFSVSDRDGRILAVNTRFAELLGYAPQELAGRSYRDITHPEDREDSQAWLGRLNDGSLRSYQLDKRYLARDGRVVQVHLRVSPLPGDEGRLIVQVEDVTERRRQEREMAELSARLDLATRSVGLGVWELNLGTGVVVWNEQMHRIYGTDPGEGPLTHEHWRARVHPEDRTAAEARFAAALGGEDLSETPFRIVRPDGAVRHVRATAHLVREADGTPLRILGVNRDVTDQEEAHEALNRAKEELQVIIDHMPAMVGYWGRDLRNRFASRSYQAWFGRTPEEIHGRHIRELLGEALYRANEPYMAKVLEGETQVFERTIPGPSGIRHAIASYVPDVQGGEVLGFYAFVSDITPLKEAQLALAEARDQAERASRLKSEFVANVSHEIRTPLNAVLGLAQLLARTRLDAAQRRQVEMIESAGRALLGLLNEVLDFAKVEAGRMELAEEAFQLDEVLDPIAVTMAMNAKGKGLELVISEDPGLPQAFLGDPLRLQQVLMNLTGNAVKFTERGGVTLRVEPAEGGVRFRVQDTGIGMDEAQQARLFQAFQQGDASTSRRFGGTGLGLVIAKRLVELMGGRIGVRSRPGEGSEFEVVLPFQALPAAPSPAEPHPLPALVVEPPGASRGALLAALAAAGWSAEPVDDLDAALRLLPGRHGVACLAVREAPGGTGAAVEALRAADPDRPVLLMAASPEDAAAADGFLSRPFTRASLRKSLDAALAGAGVRGRGGEGPSMPLSGLRLLLVEDNPLNQEVARGLLEAAGASVDVAGSGEEALDRLRPGHPAPHLVLMDVQMPGMDGCTAARLLRERGLRVPILAMTAGLTTEERARCLAAGMDDIVAKPVEAARLNAAVARHAGRGGGARMEALDRLLEAAPGGSPTYRAAVLDLVAGQVAKGAQPLLEARTALVDGRPQDACRILHTLRGSIGLLGAQAFVALAGDLEQAIQSGGPVPPDRFDPVVRELEAVLARTRAWLDQAGHAR